MSTGYGWEGLRQVCATLLSARHVPERPCGGLVYLRRYNKCSPLPFYLSRSHDQPLVLVNGGPGSAHVLHNIALQVSAQKT